MTWNRSALPAVNEPLAFRVVIVPADAHCLPCIDCCNQDGVAGKPIAAADETEPKAPVAEIQPWPRYA
jgi:hypothetical protein